MLKRFRWKKAYLLPLIIFLIAILARTIPGPRTIDDSYITYRYARNILAGNGFVYNPGERVLGTTTPLYTILLTVIGAFSGGIDAPFPTISMLINAIFDGLTCLLLLFIGRKMSSHWAGIGTALAWAVAPFSVTFAIGGLETSLFILLLTAIIWTHLSGLHILTALFSALSILTRPDALILVGPVILERSIQLWKSKTKQSNTHVTISPENFTWNASAHLKEVIVFTVLTLGWLIFSTAYFGNPLPNSMAAKTVAYRLPAEAAFVRLLQHYATPFLGHLTFGIGWIKIGLVLYPFLFIVGLRNLLRQDKRIWPYLAYPWIYFVVFSIANPLIFRWYLTPPLPPLMFGVLAGVENLANNIGSNRKSIIGQASNTKNNKPLLKFILPLIFIVPALLTFHGWQLKPDHGINRPAPEMAWYNLELLYQHAANIIKPDIHPQTILAAGDVGVLGYLTGAKILDTVGLNSPITAKYYPLESKYYVINYAIPPDLVLDQRPDYLVILEVYGRLGLLKDPGFHSGYKLIEKIPTDIYGSDGMLIYKKIN